MLKIKQDSRDLKFHEKFGQVVDLPTNLFFDTNIPDVVQQPGDVRCTCITICDIATDMTGRMYDIDELFNRIPHDSSGADPKDAIKEAINGGLYCITTKQYEKLFSSYWRADTGRYDAFDNVRSALEKAQRGIAIWSGWYQNWNGQYRLPIGDKIISYHMYEIEGVKISTTGEVVLILETWLGRKMEINRDTFNWLMSKSTSSTAVLSDSTVDVKRDKTIWEIISDIIANLWIQINNLKIDVDNYTVQNQKSAIIEPMETKSERLYNLAYSLIGKYLTLDTSVPKQFNCAQAMSFILKEFGFPMPARGIAGTVEMEKWLIKNCTEVKTPELGDIIISVSFTGLPNARGHVGVVGKKAIMSNDSDTGTWQPYWSLPAWLKFYRDEKKLRTRYFRV